MRIGIATNFHGAAAGHIRTEQHLGAAEKAALDAALNERELMLLVLDAPWFQRNRQDLDGKIVIHQGIHRSKDRLHVSLQWYPVVDWPAFGHLYVVFSEPHKKYIAEDHDVVFIKSQNIKPAETARFYEW